MLNEASLFKTKDVKKELQEQVVAQLTLPEKRNEGNPDKNMTQHLGSFLVKQGYVTKIDMWRGSWGYKYENKTIYINELPMPSAQYNYYIFRLGENSSSGKALFPAQGDEADQYRFLHETSHAYQDYLQHEESSENPAMWYNKALNDEIDSNLGLLFKFCYSKRSNNPGKGLSTWGNVPDYNNIADLRSQNATRAIEDANELITMYLWHPEYLDTFLNYVAGKIPGYGETNLEEDRLLKITEEEKEALQNLIEEYVEEMKRIILDKKSNS